LIFTCYGWWFQPRPWQRRFYRDGPNAILAISEAVKRGFLGKPPFMSPDRVQVLHLGVDTTRFRPRPEERAHVRKDLQAPTDVPLVTLLGRFQHAKGQDVFLEACRLIATRAPKARFVLAGENVFGGSTEEAFKRRMISQALGDPLLRETVHFSGWVDRPERLLAASDVVVCSSRFESFGMALIEAMASEVPVVSTNIGGPAEIVAEGETGYLVPPGRPDLIAERVLALLEDGGLRRRMGTAGRARAKDRFELSRYAAGFAAVMESLVGGA
jgi:glycosyltransferase involved in cell wall biosynthesis